MKPGKWKVFFAIATLFLCLAAFVRDRGLGPTNGDATRQTQSRDNPVDQVSKIPLYDENASDYFRALGYGICEHQSAVQMAQKLWMHLRTTIDEATCAAVFNEFLAAYDIVPDWPPPEDIPASLKDCFLLDGRVLEAKRYFAQRYDGVPQPLQWSPESVQPYLDKAKESGLFTYGSDTSFVYRVLEDYPLTGQTGMVIGSETPWLEAILLTKGKAAKLLTLEFHPINSTVPEIEYLSPRELSNTWKTIASRNLDFAFTFSSLEHTGLGRYGDRLDPDGDLRELRKLSCVLRDGALVFLGLPIGADALVWNAHRIYGPWRLPLITANYEVLGLYTNGKLQDPFAFANTRDALPYGNKQAIIVMRNAKENAKC